MKNIGLLGGAGWPSTIGYYQILNKMVNERLGGYHSAKILLYSIDFHSIKSNYGKDDEKVAQSLQEELSYLISKSPDSIIICCNSLHKYYDLIKDNLNSNIPVFHAVDLTYQYINQKGFNNILLLATKFTMEDGFFAQKLEKQGIKVTIPTESERIEIQQIHDQLNKNLVTDKARDYFKKLISNYKALDAVVLACTEFQMAINQENSILEIIDPVILQGEAAVRFSLHTQIRD